jgi:hypothetical protein
MLKIIKTALLEGVSQSGLLLGRDIVQQSWRRWWPTPKTPKRRVEYIAFDDVVKDSWSSENG